MTKAPPNRVSKQRSVDPFDSDSDSELRPTSKPARTPSVPVPGKDNESREGAASKKKCKNGVQDSDKFENMTVQELENYAVNKAEETTRAVHGCLKIAEDIKEDATNTLITLHQQGEQITGTHAAAANIDHDLSMATDICQLTTCFADEVAFLKDAIDLTLFFCLAPIVAAACVQAEKLLGSLGGIFSKPWKPKKARSITGPVITKEDSFKRRGNQQEQRERLGLSNSPKGRSKNRQYNTASAALEQVEVEKSKQDDALSDLSDVLGQLKNMAVDMGTEIERQNKALDHLNDDVDELNSRVKGANQRTRRLLGK
ncbi:Helical region found in SNARE [Asimina triloba]